MSTKEERAPWIGGRVRLVPVSVAAILTGGAHRCGRRAAGAKFERATGTGDSICVRAGCSDDHNQSRNAQPVPNGWRDGERAVAIPATVRL